MSEAGVTPSAEKDAIRVPDDDTLRALADELWAMGVLVPPSLLGRAFEALATRIPPPDQKPPPPGPGATSRMVTEVAITRDLPPEVTR